MNLLGTKANLMYDLDFTHWDESHLADDWSSLRSQFYGESVRQIVSSRAPTCSASSSTSSGSPIRGEATVEVDAPPGRAGARGRPRGAGVVRPCGRQVPSPT